MKNFNVTALPFPMLVVLAILVMLGLQGLIEYRLLAPRSSSAAQFGDDIQQLRIKLKAEAANLKNSQALQPSKTATQLKDIMVRLGSQPPIAGRVDNLHKTASQHNVAVRQVSYRNPKSEGAIARHEMQADLAGTYPAIRQFLRAVLVQDQAVAIESVEFSRLTGNAGAKDVRAQVRLVLYFRRALPSPAP